MPLESVPVKRVGRSKQKRRRIVELTIATGDSVARIARALGINSNQVYAWRRLYKTGLLSPPAHPVALVPVRITDTAPAVEASLHGARQVPSGSIQIDLAHARVQIEGAADPSTLRTVLEFLRG